MRILKLLMLVAIISVWNNNSLQGQGTNPLEKAKMLNSQQKYEAAENLLQRYVADHPKDLYGEWLYAHTLHLTGKYQQSQRMYLKIINQYPYNNDLKLDRINKLAEAGRLNKAIGEINRIKNGLPKDYKYVAEKTLARIYFWKGDYDKAYAAINSALRIYPTEQSGIDLRHTIIQARSNRATAELDIFTDDQPITVITPIAGAMFYINSMISAGGDIRYPVHSLTEDTYSTPWIRALANFNFIETGIGVKVSTGLIHYSSDDNAVSGSIDISKKFLKHLTVSAKFAYEPYLATSFAVTGKLMQTSYGIDFDWNDPKGLIGKAGYGNNIFSSLDNDFHVVSGWLVSPPLKVSDFSFRAGYGINYSDGKTNTFTAKESLDSILVHWDSTYMIAGNYKPFFSPNNQLIHSVVGMINYSPGKNISLGVDVNYGFSARTDAPYLFLDKSDEDEIFIGRNFEKENYHPLDINAYAHYKITEDLTAKVFYKYQKTFYYQSNLIGIAANFTF